MGMAHLRITTSFNIHEFYILHSFSFVFLSQQAAILLPT